MKLYPDELGLLERIRNLRFARVGGTRPLSREGEMVDVPVKPAEAQLILLLRRGVTLKELEIHNGLPAMAIEESGASKYFEWEEPKHKLG